MRTLLPALSNLDLISGVFKTVRIALLSFDTICASVPLGAKTANQIELSKFRVPFNPLSDIVGTSLIAGTRLSVVTPNNLTLSAL